MAGAPISTFSDTGLTTGPAILTSDVSFVNEVQRQTYTLPRFMSGKQASDMLQGGETIRDDIYFDLKSSYTHYLPNQSFSYNNPQVLTQWSVAWRFTKAEAVWTAQEIGLNANQLNSNARHHRFKKLLNAKIMNLMTDLSEGFENDLWATPATATMEAATGSVPYSIGCFVTEHDPDTTLTGGDFTIARQPNGFTNVQGIDPTSADTDGKWANQLAAYTGGGNLGDQAYSLFATMTKMWRLLKFSRMPKGPEYSDPATQPNLLACSLDGITVFEDGLRRSQDLFVMAGRQDPSFSGPMFRGIPVEYIEALDDAALYPSAAAGTGAYSTEQGVATGHRGPRFWMLNTLYMLMVWHSDRYFHRIAPFQPDAQPMTTIMMVDCWHNLVCRSRRRQGLIVPKGANALIPG